MDEQQVFTYLQKQKKAVLLDYPEETEEWCDRFARFVASASTLTARGEHALALEVANPQQKAHLQAEVRRRKIRTGATGPKPWRAVV